MRPAHVQVPISTPIDGKVIIATEGDILVAPANAPHRFENMGPGRLEMIDIHANPTFVTVWL